MAPSTVASRSHHCNAGGGSRREDEAAKIGGMDRQTLRNWVHRLNAPGAEAFSIIEQIPELAHVGGAVG